MNDFSELEAELKKLRPTRPSQELFARVEAAIQQSTTAQGAGVMKRRTIRWNWLPLGLGLAATAAFLVLARVNVDHAPKSSRTLATNSPAASAVPQSNRASTVTPSFIPEGLTQVVYNTRDEGIHFVNDATPVRRIRSQKRETLRWHDPQTGASLRVTYPAEEVVLTPADGQ